MNKIEVFCKYCGRILHVYTEENNGIEYLDRYPTDAERWEEQLSEDCSCKDD